MDTLPIYVFGALFALVALFVAVIVRMYVDQSQRNERLQEQMVNLVFHSRFSEKRADMEESLLSLGRKFQDRSSDFADIQHLALRAQKLTEGSSNKFLESMGLSEDLPVTKNQVFVLTPFSDVETETFAIIRHALVGAGLSVFRGDEKTRSDVFSHIVKSMLESRVVIANLNGRNPNVMYELGIAHALDKPVVMVAEMSGDLEDIPFDLRAKSIVLYDDSFELKGKIASAVLQVLAEDLV